VSPRTVAFFTAQGIPREILFYLFTDRLIETRRGVRREIRNDPLSSTFVEFQQYVELAMQYGLSSETIEREGGPRKKGAEHEEHEESRLCFDPMYKAPNVSLKGLRPICGSKVPFHGGRNSSTFISRTGEPIGLEIRPRSTFEIFNYLGRIVAAREAGIVHLSNAEDNASGAVPDDILFRVLPATGVEPCFITVVYAGTIYCVPSGTAPNTTRILGLLAQLLALNTSITDLPATPTVHITP
jgi:hypothetical protein